MTCPNCNGTHKTKMLDVWKSRAFSDAANTDWKLADIVVDGVPCPKCHYDDFWGYVSARIDREGQPFTDGDIKSAEAWRTPDGEDCIVLTTREEPING